MPKELLMPLGKTNNNKTVQSILCGDCSGYKYIYASLRFPYFCLWDVYMNTEPLLFGNSPVPRRCQKFLLLIIHVMKPQFFVVPSWLDGWTMGGTEI